MNPNLSQIRMIYPEKKRKIYRAGWILVSPKKIIENGCLEVERGKISRIFPWTPKGWTKNDSCMDLGNGVIMPPLVNAHIHLELSALKNKLSHDHGFSAWVQDLLSMREALGRKTLTLEAEKAVNELACHGTGYIGEISTLGITRPLLEPGKSNRKISGVWFREFLGSDRPGSELKAGKYLSFSLAGHAPHTTAPGLLSWAKKKTASVNLPFSIHLAESDAESGFIMGDKCQWGDFLASRGIDTSSWPIGNKTPVKYLDELGVLDPLTLVVHLLNVNDQDLDILSRKRAGVCLCPRSNYNLHKKLPDIEKMLGKNLKPALGTDSLASCGSLSLFDEMAFVRKKYPGLSPEKVLAMATENGAWALGLESVCGSLEKNKPAQFLYADFPASTASSLIESLTCNEK